MEPEGLLPYSQESANFEALCIKWNILTKYQIFLRN